MAVVRPCCATIVQGKAVTLRFSSSFTPVVGICRLSMCKLIVLRSLSTHCRRQRPLHASRLHGLLEYRDAALVCQSLSSRLSVGVVVS